MIIEPTGLGGLYTVQQERFFDQRGFFARTWCAEEFADVGLNPEFVQTSVSHNERANTLRGMHFQREPHAETKLVTCVVGAVYDVLLDMRPESPTYLQWRGFELTAESGLQVLAGPGFAHGFQTLTDHSVVTYHIDEYYAPDASTGVRWDDPAFGIEWPDAAERVISEKDQAWPDFAPA